MPRPPEPRGGRRPLQKGRLRARPPEPPRPAVPSPRPVAADSGAAITIDTPLAAPAGERALRSGWRVIAAKEFTDHLLSARFLVLVLILGLAGAVAVNSAASAIHAIPNKPSVAPGVFLLLFTAAPSQVPSFVVLIAFLGPLLGIAFGFDAVNGERAERTLPRLLAQPIHRDDVVNGKFVGGLAAIGCILAAVVLLVAGIGLFQLGIVPGLDDVLRMLVWLVVAIVYVGFWLAFAMLCSVAVRRQATSALIALGFWLLLSMFSALLVGLVADAVSPLPANPTYDQQAAHAQLQLDLAHVSPGQLFSEATDYLLDPGTRTVGIATISQQAQAASAVPSILPLDQSLLLGWPQVVGLLALTAGCFGLAYASFLRQEVRA